MKKTRKVTVGRFIFFFCKTRNFLKKLFSGTETAFFGSNKIFLRNWNIFIELSLFWNRTKAATFSNFDSPSNFFCWIKSWLDLHRKKFCLDLFAGCTKLMENLCSDFFGKLCHFSRWDFFVCIFAPSCAFQHFSRDLPQAAKQRLILFLSECW